MVQEKKLFFACYSNFNCYFLTFSLADLFIYRDKKQLNTVILIDISASMNIKYKRKSRFDHAYKEALQLIDTATVDKKIALAHINNELTLVSPLLNNRKILASYLNDIKPSHLKGAILQKHIDLLRDLYSNNVQIVVFTDHVPNIVESDNISYKIYSGSDGNAAITSLDFFNDKSGQSIVKLKIQCDYIKPFFIPLVIEKAGDLFIEKELSLNSGETVEIEIPLKTNEWTGISGVIKMDINDAYNGDNIACFEANPEIYVKINGKSDYLSRAVNANPQVLIAEKFDELKKNIQISVNQPGGGDFYTNNIIVNPVSGKNCLSVGEKLDLNKPIKAVYRDHPVLDNVDLGRFIVPYAYRVDLPEESVVLAEIDKVPLLFCLQSINNRMLVINFSLDETDFISQISFPILIANALEWLSNDKSTEKQSLLSEDESITLKGEKNYREAEVRRNIYLEEFCIITSLVLLFCEGVFFYGFKKQRRIK